MDLKKVNVDDRIIYWSEDIGYETSQEVVKSIYSLSRKSHDTIYLILNSYGGYTSCIFNVVDAIEHCRNVNTVCMGICLSAAAIILASGAKRYASKHSRIMIHEGSSAHFGSMTDMEVDMEEMKKQNEAVAKILSVHTGKTVQDILGDMRRDKYMSAHQAKRYGLVDVVGLPNCLKTINERKEQ